MFSETPTSESPLVEIRGLSVEIEAGGNSASILRGVDLSIEPGEAHGLVGESGSGKTTLGKALLRLQSPASYRLEGRIRFQGQDLLRLPESEMRSLRGPSIAYIPQDAQSSLSPHQRVSAQFLELLKTHTALSPEERRQRASTSLQVAGLSESHRVLPAYPHQLSVGMAQRVLIAMALSLQPRLLVADEPTSSLDVVSSSRITDLLAELNERTGLAILLITHDFEVLFKVAQRVSVMYGGEIVERGPVETLKERPSHPYTQALLAARMLPGNQGLTIAGEPPEPHRRPSGCVFHPRCPEAQTRCSQQHPAQAMIAESHSVRCLLRQGESS